MARKAVPARAKKQYPDGSVLYAWRDTPGGRERAGKGPGGDANLVRYQAHVLDCWETGAVPDKPSEVLGPTASTGSTPSRCPTLREFLGSPDNPGELFAHTKARLSDKGQERYFSQLRHHGAIELIGNMPLDKVTFDDAERVIDRLLRCPQCISDATEAGRTITDRQARADKEAPDCPSHLPASAKARDTAMSVKGTLVSTFNAARQAGHVTVNPFEARTIGFWDEPPTNDDGRLALTITQFDAVLQAHPDELRVVASTSTYAMLRRAEMWGLQRQDFPAPPEDAADDPTNVTFSIARVWDDDARRFVPRGKNSLSTGVMMALPTRGARILNDHLRTNWLPNPDCPTCARGHGLWRQDLPNPHEGCGWADDAPLIPRDMCSPDHYNTVLKRVQVAAGLDHLPFRMTHRGFRSTGATLHLLAGTPDYVVVQMGRWQDASMLRKTYFRLYGEAYEDATTRLSRMEATELGEDGADIPLDLRVRYLERQLEAANQAHTEIFAENERLRAGLGLEQRQPASPIEPVPVMAVKGKWGAITDDQLREAVAASRTRAEIMRRLGFTAVTYNMRLLERRATELGIELPAKWAGRSTTPRPAPKPRVNKWLLISDDGIRAAVAKGASRSAILRELGANKSFDDYRQLEERAAALGLELPVKYAQKKRRERATTAPRTRKWAAVSDDDLRAFIDAATSRADVLRAVGVARAPANYAMLDRRAAAIGVALPPKQDPIGRTGTGPT